jgi:hypothetical protein
MILLAREGWLRGSLTRGPSTPRLPTYCKLHVAIPAFKPVSLSTMDLDLRGTTSRVCSRPRCRIDPNDFCHHTALVLYDVRLRIRRICCRSISGVGTIMTVKVKKIPGM